MNIPIHPCIYSELRRKHSSQMTCQMTGRNSTNEQSYPPLMSSQTRHWELYLDSLSLDPCIASTRNRLANELSFASVDWAGPKQPLAQMKVHSSRTLGWTLGMFTQMVPTPLCFYSILGPPTSI